MKPTSTAGTSERIGRLRCVETTAAEQRVADSLATHPPIVAARSFVNATAPSPAPGGRDLNLGTCEIVLSKAASSCDGRGGEMLKSVLAVTGQPEFTKPVPIVRAHAPSQPYESTCCSPRFRNPLAETLAFRCRFCSRSPRQPVVTASAAGTFMGG